MVGAGEEVGTLGAETATLYHLGHFADGLTEDVGLLVGIFGCEQTIADSCNFGGGGEGLVVVGGFFEVVFVEGAEVGRVEFDVVIETEADTDTDAVGVDVEGNVVHHAVVVGIEGALHTGADFPLTVEVVFGTGEELLGAVVEEVVLVGVLHTGFGLLVEIVVVAEVEAETFDGTNAKTDGEKSGDVAAHFGLVGEGCKLLAGSGRGGAVLRLVGEGDAGAELIFGRHVEETVVEVGTDDGGEAEGVLVDVDAHVLGGLSEGTGGVGELAVGAEFLIVGLGQLGLLFGFRALGLCQSDVARRAGSLGFGGSGLRVLLCCEGETAVGFGVTLVVGAQFAEVFGGGYHFVAAAIASVDADVAEVAIVVGCGEYTAHTAIDGEVFADAVTGTEGEPVEVLAAVHVGVDVVAVETECVVGIADRTEEGDFAFEAAEAVIVGGFTTAAYESEVDLEAEGTVDPGALQRGDDGGFGFGLEGFGGGIIIANAVFEGFEGGLDFARLVGGLEVDAEVETGLEEVDTGRIGVDTVQVDVGVLCGVAQEGDALVGVGEIATGHHAQGAAEQHGRQYNFLHGVCENVVVGLDCERKVTTSLHTNKETVRRRGLFSVYLVVLSGRDSGFR